MFLDSRCGGLGPSTNQVGAWKRKQTRVLGRQIKDEDAGSRLPLEVKQSEKGCAMQSGIGEPRPTGVTSQPLNKKTKGTLTGALGDQENTLKSFDA